MVTCVPTSTTRPVGIWKKSVASLALLARLMKIRSCHRGMPEWAAGRIERFAGEATPPQRAIPGVALALAIVVPVVTTVSNQLSRRVEARADSYSLELTDEPDAFIAFEKRLALRNVSDPDPPALRSFLLGTHPPTIERIGIGEAWRRGER